MTNFEKKVPVIISIRNNSNYEVVSYESEEIITEKGFNNYSWTEGNYGCDCNRELFFNEHRANIEYYSHGKDFATNKCGTGKYFVNVVNRDTKEVYFQQFPITEDQKIKELAYKECFKALFGSIPKINLDMMLLQGEVQKDVFLFRNIAAYANLSCKMTVKFEFKLEK